MKIKTTLLAASFILFGASSFAQEVWDDFDNPENVIYDYFDGTGFDQAFANPNTGGSNSSALCAEYIRNGGVQYDVIVIDPAGTNSVDDVTDYLSGTKTMTIKVYSPAPGITLQITLEDKNEAGPSNYPTGRHSEYTTVTTTTNQWETLTFAFQQQPDASVGNTDVNRLVLLFDPGSFTSTTFVWDDLMGPEFVDPCAGTTPDPTILDNFECQRHITYQFSNGNFATEANPLMAGINQSTAVGKFTKFPPPTNDGAFGGPLATPFTSATYNVARIQLYSPAAPQDFVMILQDGSANNLIDTTFTTSSTNSWEEFTADLRGIPSSTSIESIVLLLDPSTATEDTIYLDNITLELDATFGLTETGLANQVSVYPSPFNDQITVSAETPLSEVMVTDLTGKLVFVSTGLNTQQLTIDAGAYAHGAYLITVIDMNGNAFSRKLIK